MGFVLAGLKLEICVDKVLSSSAFEQYFISESQNKVCYMFMPFQTKFYALLA